MRNWNVIAAICAISVVWSGIAGCGAGETPSENSRILQEEAGSQISQEKAENPVRQNADSGESENGEFSGKEESEPDAWTVVQGDFADAFQSVNGCAVLLDSAGSTVTFYQEEMCRERVSPASTFKVVSALTGLHHQVLQSKDSRMGYEGSAYAREEWNQDVSLKEAFQSSCVWYFRKVIDAVGPEAVQEDLNGIGYGNCDISQWAGSNVNNGPELNGFWLESSLKISPLEQAELLQRIVEGNTIYTEGEVGILKEIMLVEEKGSERIYGKTGSGKKGRGWFVGFDQREDTTIYFAVYLEDDSAENVNGALAREIALKILQM